MVNNKKNKRITLTTVWPLPTILKNGTSSAHDLIAFSKNLFNLMMLRLRGNRLIPIPAIGSNLPPDLESARRRTKPRTVDLYDAFLRGALSFEKRVPVADAPCGLPQLGHLLQVRHNFQQWSQR